MPADAPTAQSVITSACRKLNIIGALETSPPAEMNEVALNEMNEILGQWQTRKRYAFFQREQLFTFTTSQATYSIGRSTNTPTPDFIVDSGDRPVKIEYCQLVFTDTTPPIYIPLDVYNIEIQQTIPQPQLSSTFPNGIYYRPTWPNGTIIPWPAFPTMTTYKLNLAWWNQLDTVSSDDVNVAMIMPMGGARALALILAEALSLIYPAKTNLEKLYKEAAKALADFLGPNTPPTVISSTDGIQSGYGTFDYRSRTFG